MAKLLNNIIMEILEFIYREGGNHKTWHIGITRDPRQRLFDDHQVDYRSDAWIWRTAASEGEALQIQSYFLEFGLAEGEEEWLPGACAVYAYRKHTEPFIKTRLDSARVRNVRRRLRHRPIISATETGGTAEK
jgi:hypothetical protein